MRPLPPALLVVSGSDLADMTFFLGAMLFVAVTFLHIVLCIVGLGGNGLFRTCMLRHDAPLKLAKGPKVFRAHPADYFNVNRAGLSAIWRINLDKKSTSTSPVAML